MCSGQITTSPSSRSAGGPAIAPSPSTGKDSTSVGPALPRCSALSAAIASASTKLTATWPSSMPADAGGQHARAADLLGVQRVAEHLDLEPAHAGRRR